LRSRPLVPSSLHHQALLTILRQTRPAHAAGQNTNEPLNMTHHRTRLPPQPPHRGGLHPDALNATASVMEGSGSYTHMNLGAQAQGMILQSPGTATKPNHNFSRSFHHAVLYLLSLSDHVSTLPFARGLEQYLSSVPPPTACTSCLPDMECLKCWGHHPVGQGCCTQWDTAQWEKPSGHGWRCQWQGDQQSKQQGSPGRSSYSTSRCHQCGKGEQIEEEATCELCSVTNSMLNERVLLDTGTSYLPQVKAFITTNHDINDRAKEHTALWTAVSEYYSAVRRASKLHCGPTRTSHMVQAQNQFDDACLTLAPDKGTTHHQPQARRWNGRDHAYTPHSPQALMEHPNASSSQSATHGMDHQGVDGKLCL
jgi:hypothetical protein